MKKILFLFLFTFCLVGCNDKDKIDVYFKCNGIKKEYRVGIGSRFKCSLFASDYDLEIISIDKDKFTIQSNGPLATVDASGRINTGSTQKTFEIKKGQLMELAVPLDGLLYTIEFEW